MAESFSDAIEGLGSGNVEQHGRNLERIIEIIKTHQRHMEKTRDANVEMQRLSKTLDGAQKASSRLTSEIGNVKSALKADPKNEGLRKDLLSLVQQFRAQQKIINANGKGLRRHINHYRHNIDIANKYGTLIGRNAETIVYHLEQESEAFRKGEVSLDDYRKRLEMLNDQLGVSTSKYGKLIDRQKQYEELVKQTQSGGQVDLKAIGDEDLRSAFFNNDLENFGKDLAAQIAAEKDEFLKAVQEKGTDTDPLVEEQNKFKKTVPGLISGWVRSKADKTATRIDKHLANIEERSGETQRGFRKLGDSVSSRLSKPLQRGAQSLRLMSDRFEENIKEGGKFDEMLGKVGLSVKSFEKLNSNTAAAIATGAVVYQDLERRFEYFKSVPSLMKPVKTEFNELTGEVEDTAKGFFNLSHQMLNVTRVRKSLQWQALFQGFEAEDADAVARSIQTKLIPALDLTGKKSAHIIKAQKELGKEIFSVARQTGLSVEDTIGFIEKLREEQGLTGKQAIQVLRAVDRNAKTVFYRLKAAYPDIENMVVSFEDIKHALKEAVMDTARYEDETKRLASAWTAVTEQLIKAGASQRDAFEIAKQTVDLLAGKGEKTFTKYRLGALKASKAVQNVNKEIAKQLKLENENLTAREAQTLANATFQRASQELETLTPDQIKKGQAKDFERVVGLLAKQQGMDADKLRTSILESDKASRANLFRKMQENIVGVNRVETSAELVDALNSMNRNVSEAFGVLPRSEDIAQAFVTGNLKRMQLERGEALPPSVVASLEMLHAKAIETVKVTKEDRDKRLAGLTGEKRKTEEQKIRREEQQAAKVELVRLLEEQKRNDSAAKPTGEDGGFNAFGVLKTIFDPMNAIKLATAATALSIKMGVIPLLRVIAARGVAGAEMGALGGGPHQTGGGGAAGKGAQPPVRRPPKGRFARMRFNMANRFRGGRMANALGATRRGFGAVGGFIGRNPLTSMLAGSMLGIDPLMLGAMPGTADPGAVPGAAKAAPPVSGGEAAKATTKAADAAGDATTAAAKKPGMFSRLSGQVGSRFNNLRHADKIKSVASSGGKFLTTVAKPLAVLTAALDASAGVKEAQKLAGEQGRTATLDETSARAGNRVLSGLVTSPVQLGSYIAAALPGISLEDSEAFNKKMTKGVTDFFETVLTDTARDVGGFLSNIYTGYNRHQKKAQKALNDMNDLMKKTGDRRRQLIAMGVEEEQARRQALDEFRNAKTELATGVDMQKVLDKAKEKFGDDVTKEQFTQMLEAAIKKRKQNKQLDANFWAQKVNFEALGFKTDSPTISKGVMTSQRMVPPEESAVRLANVKENLEKTQERNAARQPGMQQTATAGSQSNAPHTTTPQDLVGEPLFDPVTGDLRIVFSGFDRVLQKHEKDQRFRVFKNANPA